MSSKVAAFQTREANYHMLSIRRSNTVHGICTGIHDMLITEVVYQWNGCLSELTLTSTPVQNRSSFTKQLATQTLGNVRTRPHTRLSNIRRDDLRTLGVTTQSQTEQPCRGEAHACRGAQPPDRCPSRSGKKLALTVSQKLHGIIQN